MRNKSRRILSESARTSTQTRFVQSRVGAGGVSAEGVGSADSLFFAVVPNDDERVATSSCISRLGTDLGLRFKTRPSSVLHATAMKVGTFEAQQRQIELVKQLAGLTRAAPFALVFDRVMSFGGGALVLACSEAPDSWRALCRQLRTAPLRLGLPAIGGSSPHATFSYVDAVLPSTPVEPPVSWRVDSFVLVRSHHGETRHTELGRWPLRG